MSYPAVDCPVMQVWSFSLSHAWGRSWWISLQSPAKQRTSVAFVAKEEDFSERFAFTLGMVRHRRTSALKSWKCTTAAPWCKRWRHLTKWNIFKPTVLDNNDQQNTLYLKAGQDPWKSMTTSNLKTHRKN